MVKFGTPNTVCITSGGNRFLDTIADPNDAEDVDPADSTLRVVKAGANGVCQTEPNDDDIAPPSGIPSATELQNYLNNTTWGRQANIFLRKMLILLLPSSSDSGDFT